MSRVANPSRSDAALGSSADIRAAALQDGVRVDRLAGYMAIDVDDVENAKLSAAQKRQDEVIAKMKRLKGPFLASRLVSGARELALSAGMAVLSERVERSTGLSIRHLLHAHRYLMRGLEIRQGKASPFLEELLSCQSAPVFIRLGPDPERETTLDALLRGEAQRLARGEYPDPRVPPKFLPAKLAPVWHQLVERHQAGRPLFSVLLDEDPSSPLEPMTYEVLASAAENTEQMRTRLERETAYFLWNDSWLRQNRPEAYAALTRAKALLTPAWLEGRGGTFGYALRQKNALAAFTEVVGPAMRGDGRVRSLYKISSSTLSDVLDIVGALHQDTQSGVQTYWLKLLRELPLKERSSLLGVFSHAVVAALVSGELPVIGPNDYLRSDHILDVVSETLASLSYEERRMVGNIVLHAVRRKAQLVSERDQKMKAMLPGYPGLDFEHLATIDTCSKVAPVIAGQPGFREAISVLSSFRPEDRGDWQEVKRHKGLLELIALIAERPAQLDFAGFESDPPKAPVLVGEFYGAALGRTEIRPEQLPPIHGRRSSTTLGAVGESKTNSAAPKVRASLVLEGGGGKGMAYPAVLDALSERLANKDGPLVQIDEYVGTSAGAITAGLLAAGYSPKELGKLSKELRFTEFYSDYVTMSGGVDQRLRATNRNGLFSTRRMYETIHGLLAEKLGIHGRPIFFADLPNALKVPAMVVARDVPPSIREQLEVAPDGLIEFSKTRTPYMDVAAAITASASVPVFFQSPIVHVTAPSATVPSRLRTHHLQLVDGGALLNFPTALATRSKERKTALCALPVYFRTPESSGPTLTTLDFGKVSEELDELNRRKFAELSTRLPELLKSAQAKGYDRVVFALNLAAPNQQTALAIQGESAESSEELRALAKSAGVPTLTERKTDRLLAKNGNAPAPIVDFLGETLFEALLETPDRPWRARGEDGSSTYVPRKRSLTGIEEVLAAVLAGTLTSKELFAARRFEK